MLELRDVPVDMVARRHDRGGNGSREKRKGAKKTMAKKSAQPKRPASKVRAKKSAAKTKPAPKQAKKTKNSKKTDKAVVNKESSGTRKVAPKKSPPKKKKSPASKSTAGKKPAKPKAKAAGTKTTARRKSMKTAKTAATRSKTATTAGAIAQDRPAAAKKSAAAPHARNVEGYVSTLNGWRKECVASLRKMIQKAAPEASEKVKWAQPVYEHHGPFAWIKAHAKHVHLGFWRGVELPDPRNCSRARDRRCGTSSLVV